jgi:hypothetical protein
MCPTYRELPGFGFLDVEGLPPEQLIPHWPVCIWVFIPVDDFGLVRDTQGLDYIHMITRYQLAVAVVRLSPLRKIFRSVEPVYSQVDMRRIARANLENPSHPVRYGIFCVLFFLGFGDEDDLANFEFGVADCDVVLVPEQGNACVLAYS